MTAAGLASRTAGLARVGALAAILGGVLRIVSSFIPYEANSAAHETLYLIIDVCFVFGLIAVYITVADEVGMAGLAAFLVAMAGVASIVGPDAQAFGIDFYRVGALVFVAGLAGLSVQLLRKKVMVTSALLWTGTLVASLASNVFPQVFTAAGLAIGAGFVLAGTELVRLRVTTPFAAEA